MLRSACGSTTRNMVFACVMPIAAAPSVWPLSTEMMPPRTISAMYAPVFMETMSIPENTTSSVCPPLSMAKPQNITIACTIMGVPRKTSIYAASIQSLIFLSQNNTLFFGDGIVRQTPIKTPIIRPMTVLTSETNSVYPTPCSSHE